ncbi:MAG: hypothetical protein E6Q36_05625 [Chryseobacterium sp.]|nr:MAG: hypothetical protein E6Q36_05625 [Chryseobacterium sp.]
MQASARPISETKLSVDGPVNGSTPPYAVSYEMIIDSYNEESDYQSSVLVSSNYYVSLIEKYGITPLIQGIRLDSISDILDIIEGDSAPNNHFQKEVEKIAYSIVAQFEKDTLFNNYNPGKIREYIENKIFDLKDKFDIIPK